MSQDGHAVKFSRVGSYITFDDGRGPPIVSLYTMPGKCLVCILSIKSADNVTGSQLPYLKSIQFGFPRIPDPGSSAHIKVLTEWINSCDKTHKCYSKNLAFFPTRIIEISKTNSETVRVLYDTTTLDSTHKYFALSHRWGQPGKYRKFCTNTVDVIGRKERTIKIIDLPRTFRDAVTVTRNLGVPYLWIDSICIVQDDKDDWSREAKLMEQVFSSAYCTIAATCASGTDDGFLKPLPERQIVIVKEPENGAFYYLCDAIDDFHQHVDQSELNRRAWVLQERALSRRTIHFADSQTYWECGKGVRCETLTKMSKYVRQFSDSLRHCQHELGANQTSPFSPKASFLGDSHFPHSTDEFVKGKKIKLFQDLYERYSNMDLTRSEDRPVAIKGLEARLVQAFGGEGRYGVFSKYLHRCLLWRRSGAPLEPIKVFPDGPIPSWSWMTVKGGIKFIDAPGSGIDWQPDVTWPLLNGKVDDMDASWEDLSNHRDTMALHLNAPVKSLVKPRREDIILDDGSTMIPQLTKCVVIGKSKRPAKDEDRTCYALIVRLFDVHDTDVWKRIGVGVMRGRHIALDEPTALACIQ